MGVTRWFKEHVSGDSCPESYTERSEALEHAWKIEALAVSSNDAAIDFSDALIDGCVLECYFRDYMEERELLFLGHLRPLLGDYDPDSHRCGAVLAFPNSWRARSTLAGTKIRDRLDRICEQQPGPTKVIKEQGGRRSRC